MRTIERLRIVEKLATGIRRIKEYYQPYQVSPRFLVTDHSVTVVLPKINVSGQHNTNIYVKDWPQNQIEYLNQRRNQPAFQKKAGSAYPEKHALSDKEQLVLEQIRENPGITRVDLQQQINLGKTQTAEIIKNLRQQGSIVKNGNGPTTTYRAAMPGYMSGTDL